MVDKKDIIMRPTAQFGANSVKPMSSKNTGPSLGPGAGINQRSGAGMGPKSSASMGPMMGSKN